MTLAARHDADSAEQGEITEGIRVSRGHEWPRSDWWEEIAAAFLRPSGICGATPGAAQARADTAATH